MNAYTSIDERVNVSQGPCIRFPIRITNKWSNQFHLSFNSVAFSRAHSLYTSSLEKETILAAFEKKYDVDWFDNGEDDDDDAADDDDNDDDGCMENHSRREYKCLTSQFEPFIRTTIELLLWMKGLVRLSYWPQRTTVSATLSSSHHSTLIIFIHLSNFTISTAFGNLFREFASFASSDLFVNKLFKSIELEMSGSSTIFFQLLFLVHIQSRISREQPFFSSRLPNARFAVNVRCMCLCLCEWQSIHWGHCSYNELHKINNKALNKIEKNSNTWCVLLWYGKFICSTSTIPIFVCLVLLRCILVNDFCLHCVSAEARVVH